jgi:hypothetical protein
MRDRSSTECFILQNFPVKDDQIRPGWPTDKQKQIEYDGKKLQNPKPKTGGVKSLQRDDPKF